MTLTTDQKPMRPMLTVKEVAVILYGEATHANCQRVRRLVADKWLRYAPRRKGCAAKGSTRYIKAVSVKEYIS